MLQPTDVRPIEATRAAHLSVKTVLRTCSMRSRVPAEKPRKAAAVESHPVSSPIQLDRDHL
jgi:hypothetical protein